MSVDDAFRSRDHVEDYPRDDAPTLQVASGGLDVWSIFEFARRRVWIIVFSVLFMGAVGFCYYLLAPAPYTGVAILKIDTRKFQLFQPGPLGDQTIDSSAGEVESHIEALKSENLALNVIAELKLENDPEFGQAAAIPYISKLIETPRPESETWRIRNALRIFQKRLKVDRQGVYLIAISFESGRAERAAQIANAVAQTYISEQLDAKYEVTREGSKWLEGRIKELREQVSAAERAVIEYKTEHKIVDAGDGRLISQQQLSDLNNQLNAARAKTSQSRARLDRINAALNDPTDTDLINATASEALSNQLIMKLRAQYLELAAREAEWSEKYGHNHQAVVGLRNNMRGIRASILDELRRLREASKSDYDIAGTTEKLIEGQLQKAIAESQTSNEAQVKLSNLETTAVTFKSLYDNFVKRYTEATEQQSFPYTEARLITKAVPPIGRTHRKTLLIVAMTPFIGLVLGVGLGILRDLLDRGFRTSTQIETMLGLACIALVPLQRKAEVTSTGQRTPSPGRAGPYLTSGKLDIASSVGEQPFSPFAEAMRTIKLATDLTGNNSKRVLAVTSAVPDEGKSTVSAALAMSIAQVGGRVILVDGDLRNPSLSRAIVPNANAGILEVLSGEATLDQALCKQAYLSMAFLPVFSRARIADSSEVLSSNAMKRLFERLRHSYDYVIVDLPPLAPLADTRATAHLVDSYLFVVDWGRTSTAIVQHALSRAPRVYEKTVGVVLNKVDMKALDRYDGSYGRYYHDKAYGRYGYTD